MLAIFCYSKFIRLSSDCVQGAEISKMSGNIFTNILQRFYMALTLHCT